MCRVNMLAEEEVLWNTRRPVASCPGTEVCASSAPKQWYVGEIQKSNASRLLRDGRVELSGPSLCVCGVLCIVYCVLCAVCCVHVLCPVMGLQTWWHCKAELQHVERRGLTCVHSTTASSACLFACAYAAIPTHDEQNTKVGDKNKQDVSRLQVTASPSSRIPPPSPSHQRDGYGSVVS